MKTTDAKIVYSPRPPSSKDVIWGKTVNGKIEFQTFGNAGWNTVAKEDILKDIFHIKEEILEELEDYIDEVTTQADWNQSTSTESDYIKNKPAIKAGQGEKSIIEGDGITASGENSHAEGQITTAIGINSHAEGYQTTANHRSKHVFGEYNVLDPSTASSSFRGNYVEIVGNGATTSARSNARTLDWNGNEYIQGTEEALFFIGHAPSNETINGNLEWGMANLQRLKFVTLSSATNILTLPNGGNRPFSMQMKVIQDATGGRGLVINCAGGVNVFNINDFDFSVGAATQRCLVTLLWDSSEWWYSCSEYFG